MVNYLLRRLLLMIPTLFGILAVNFLIIQAAPGGPVEQMIAKIRGTAIEGSSRFGSSQDNLSQSFGGTDAGLDAKYHGAQGLDPEFIKEIEKLYGFDQPALTRFWLMIKNYLSFNLGDSYFRDISVIDLIKEKLPVSLSLGLWSTLIIYAISIPLGIRKAIKDGTPFDIVTSSIMVVGYAIPSFLFAIILIVLFSGGSFWSIFPLRGLVSENWQSLSLLQKMTDYLWHVTLPVISIVISGFASLALLTKNCFIDEIHKNYVTTARAKGLNDRRILYGHVFRNAMLLVISDFPAVILGIFFSSSLLIEVIFSLNGLGLMSFESAIGRDYPVVFGTLYFFTLIGLLINIFGDVCYTLIDPRIDFDSRDH